MRENKNNYCVYYFVFLYLITQYTKSIDVLIKKKKNTQTIF